VIEVILLFLPMHFPTEYLALRENTQRISNRTTDF